MFVGIPHPTNPYCHGAQRLSSRKRGAGHPDDDTAMSKSYYVYILASERNGTLYIGVTNDLLRRVWEHREGLLAGFTKKYAVKRLVHFEEFGDIALAIHRETRLKKWKRRWKMELIEKANPDWRDLYDAIVG
jgi:putative endonuclease